ncbi:MAG: hypothetical protein HY781_05725 [Chloroflexi bacterium]|nr:hypothetical protein [Chloroflexota bacterium]
MRKPHSLSIPKTIIVTILLVISGLAGCAPASLITPVFPTATRTNTPTATLLPTASPSPAPTEILAQTLVFYGDSSLAIGDAGDEIDHSGFSFVSNLELMLDPAFTLITANYGGRTAKWGYEHLEENVLSYQPDMVTLWWGFDDMGGCPGTFDRDTNELLVYKLESVVEDHIYYLTSQIDALLELGIPVIVMTPVPALQGNLPWSHFDENNNLIWEEGHWCSFNRGLSALVEAQRALVAGYAANQQEVYLVDVWQIYMDHPDAEKMYMDVVHPGSNGAQLIAEGWLEMFEASQR